MASTYTYMLSFPPISFINNSPVESMCFSFEKIKLDQQELGLTKDHQLDLIWLRESNEKLRKDVLKVGIYRHIITI